MYSDDGNGPIGYNIPPSVDYLCLLLLTGAYENGNSKGGFLLALLETTDGLYGMRVAETVQFSFQADPLLAPTYNIEVVRYLS